MHFTRGDVGAISFRSKSTTDLHSGVEKRPSRRDISKSAFARVFGLIAFRLLQQYLPIADVTKGAPLTPDLDLVGRKVKIAEVNLSKMLTTSARSCWVCSAI
jgi:hypothetical protein